MSFFSTFRNRRSIGASLNLLPCNIFVKVLKVILKSSKEISECLFSFHVFVVHPLAA